MLSPVQTENNQNIWNIWQQIKDTDDTTWHSADM